MCDYLARPAVTHLSLVARDCLQDSCSTVKVNAIKVLQELARVMYQKLFLNEETELKTTLRDFWSKLLGGDIVRILQSRDPLESKAKSAACDCVSDIGAGMFAELAFDKRVLIVTLVLGLVNDEDSYVRVSLGTVYTVSFKTSFSSKPCLVLLFHNSYLCLTFSPGRRNPCYRCVCVVPSTTGRSGVCHGYGKRRNKRP